MINAKKGIAHSLGQSDFIGAAKANEGVVAGMLVLKDANGDIVKAGAAASATVTDPVNTARYGFAVNNQSDGDVIESGKVGAYSLDGNSVIETDQAAATINASNYPVGTVVVPDATATGKVRAGVANGKSIGVVDSIRSIRGTAMLGIKLSA